ncbi:MAG: bifunctional hydroxymethylpyrimidine kinase/phosphomethylpyrimidine kinase [Hyphomicrobiaceae bacterium]
MLAISSQVARGAIGLSATVPALQALGHEVIALPTILLSNHPGHPRVAGERMAPELIARMLDTLAANGWLGGIDAVMTGYLPSPEHVAVARRAVEQVRAAAPAATYLCDPILGDEPKGLYIAAEAAEAIRAELVPLADVLKMNRFEAGWLSRRAVSDGASAAAGATASGWRTAIVTSLAGRNVASIGNVLIEAGCITADRQVAARTIVQKGTGDLLGALWLGHRLHGMTAAAAQARAVEGVELVLARSVGADELQLAACLRELGA